MILMEKVSKEFDSMPIISELSLEIKENEFVAIVGNSGSGKTTILNLLGFLDKQDSGNITINGICNPSKKEVQYLRRNILGFIFQHYALIENETVWKNLEISKPFNKNFSRQLAVEILEKVGLDKQILDKEVYKLSGGEQQRIALARVLLKPCSVILADEPTGNLDETNKKIIISLFEELKKMGKTIVCVTHDEDMAKSADRVIKLERKGC